MPPAELRAWTKESGRGERVSLGLGKWTKWAVLEPSTKTDNGFLKCLGHPVARTGAQVLAVHFSLTLSLHHLPCSHSLSPMVLSAVGADVRDWDAPKNKGPGSQGSPQGFTQETLARGRLLTWQQKPWLGTARSAQMLPGFCLYFSMGNSLD